MAQSKFTTSPTPSNIVSAVNAMVDDIAGKAPASHSHSVADVTSGTLPIANGGTGANNAKQARENLEVEPIGTIFAFAGNDIPKGYLPCNGGAISRTTYADLFAVIGTTYGGGDGSTTFNLPNLTDKFIQGSDTVGTVKSAGLPNIYGDGSFGGATRQLATFGFTGAFTERDLIGGLGFSADNVGMELVFQGGISLNASRCSAIYGNSDTVQPPALTMRYIIKY